MAIPMYVYPPPDPSSYRRAPNSLPRDAGGGVSPDAGNRTDWPVQGGSLSLNLHHPWTYVFVNLGLGDNVTNFNYTLTPSFWNETGNGTLCVPQLPLPAGVTPADGSKGSIQVVTLGASGSALYNVGIRIFWIAVGPNRTIQSESVPGARQHQGGSV